MILGEINCFKCNLKVGSINININIILMKGNHWEKLLIKPKLETTYEGESPGKTIDKA